MGRETLDPVPRQWNAQIVEPPLRFEGIYWPKGRVIVWLTNHADRISVLMKSEIKVGSVISTRTHREVGAALASPQPPKPPAP